MSFLRVLQRSPHYLTHFTRRYASVTTSGVESSKKSSSGPLATPLSSCLADSKLEGVNYLKAQAPVLARTDEKYPEWLWTILQPKVHADKVPGGKAERVKRKMDNKQRIKDINFMSTQ